MRAEYHEAMLLDLGMDVDPSSSSPLRVVILPWLALGHLLPYLELAERLAERGHHVTYVSTPRNLARLPPLRPAAAPRVDLVPLRLPRVDGLPDGAESTNDVPDEKRELHWRAFDGLAAPFAGLLAAACADEATRPHWIIADTFHHWAAASAAEYSVTCALLLSGAPLLAAVPALLQPWDAAATPLAASGLTLSVVQRFSLAKERCTIAAIRSCAEWEPEPLQQVVKMFGKPVVPLGLLPPSRDTTTNRSEHATARWLDAQPPGSVLYVALGSEVPLRVEQLHELALGLELAGARFLWALRKPSGAAFLDGAGSGAGDMLPSGFLERVHGEGTVTTGWVPQMSILSHGAVGGFLTHCGRNSLIEGLMFGHPLVMLPIAGDQGPNAREMEAKKVGLQVARDEKDGSFDRLGVASAVRAVMVDGEARREFVAAAARMKEVVADKELHDRYIDEFIQELRSHTAGTATARPN